MRNEPLVRQKHKKEKRSIDGPGYLLHFLIKKRFSSRVACLCTVHATTSFAKISLSAGKFGFAVIFAASILAGLRHQRRIASEGQRYNSPKNQLSE
jgi:hypothetical protein